MPTPNWIIYIVTLDGFRVQVDRNQLPGGTEPHRGAAGRPGHFDLPDNFRTAELYRTVKLSMKALPTDDDICSRVYVLKDVDHRARIAIYYERK